MNKRTPLRDDSKTDEELKKIAQEVVSYISKRSYQSPSDDGTIVVDIDEKLDSLLDKLDELSK